MTAENIGAATSLTDVPERELHDAGGTNFIDADARLGKSHAPDQGAWAQVGDHFGDLFYLGCRHTRDALGLFRGPCFGFFANVIETEHALGEIILVLPAIGQNFVQHAPQKCHVGPRSYARIFVGMRRRSGKARIDEEELGAALFGMQQVQHRDGMCFGRIAPQQEDNFAVGNVVEAVGHRSVAEGTGDAGNGGRVANAGLVIAVVGAPHGHELAVEIGSLVGKLRRSAPEYAVRPGLLTDLQDLVANLVDGLVPADARPTAVDELGWIFQAALTGCQLASGCTFGAMRAHIDDALEYRFLTGPNAVLNLGPNAAADGAKWTDCFDALGFGSGASGRLRVRRLHAGAERRNHPGQATHGQPGGVQEATPGQCAISFAFKLRATSSAALRFEPALQIALAQH